MHLHTQETDDTYCIHKIHIVYELTQLYSGLVPSQAVQWPKAKDLDICHLAWIPIADKGPYL